MRRFVERKKSSRKRKDIVGCQKVFVQFFSAHSNRSVFICLYFQALCDAVVVAVLFLYMFFSLLDLCRFVLLPFCKSVFFSLFPRIALFGYMCIVFFPRKRICEGVEEHRRDEIRTQCCAHKTRDWSVHVLFLLVFREVFLWNLPCFWCTVTFSFCLTTSPRCVNQRKCPLSAVR